MKSKKTKRLCVYCGSGSGGDPRYKSAALTLGRAMAEAGIGLVYGGGGNGLMGAVAGAVRDRGGHVTGIIPASLLELENALENITERYVTNGFHERKMLMFNLSDGFVALPGGVGTLEELVEQLTWAQLGHHEKPIYIVNTAGYWDLLLQMFDRMREQLFIRPGLETPYIVVDNVENVVPEFLKRRPARRAAAAGLIRA
ncbi:MAG: TIGR00730 family Rossman fold protein [Rhodomicrobium sp.]